MMKKHLHVLTMVVLVLAVGALMAACQPATTTQPAGGEATQPAGGEETQPAGGEVTQPAGGEATQPAGGVATQPPPSGTPQTMEAVSKDVTLDPALAEGADSNAVNSYLYEPLVGFDKGQAVPWLANSWTVAEDKLAYTFELSTDVKFSDGSTMDAEAVVASFNRWFDPADAGHGSGAYAAWLKAFGGFKGELGADGKPKSAFDGVEKAGDFTVVVHLNRPVDNLLEFLSSPPFSVTKLAGGKMLGTGAYMVGEKTATQLTLTANPYYTGPYPAEGDLIFPFK